MRALGRFVTAASIAIVGAFGFAGVVAAECDGPPPPFDETVLSSRQVFIGDVVAVKPGSLAVDGRSNGFTMHVTHAVKGGPTGPLEINEVMTQDCDGQIVARLGDRIAVALKATAFHPPVAANGVAWIEGDPPENFEKTTINEVYRLAGVPIPDSTVALDTAPERPPPWLGAVMWGLAVGLVFVVGAVVARRVSAAR
jgi:hypothetical protein